MEEFLLAQTHDAFSFLTLVAAYCLITMGLVCGGMKCEEWWKSRRKVRAELPSRIDGKSPESSLQDD